MTIKKSRNCIGLPQYKISVEITEEIISKLKEYSESFQTIHAKKTFFKGETEDYQFTGVKPGNHITLLIKKKEKADELLSLMNKTLIRGD